VLANYKKTPTDIRSLMRSMKLPSKMVKHWIQYSEKTERIMRLKEEVIKLAIHQTVTFADFKRMARKIYRTRLFRASDNWCLNYIRRYRLENIVEVPESLRDN
jgi:hypothetical protein